MTTSRPDLAGRLGGSVSRHGLRRGLWFDPLPWAFAVATLVWMLTLLRQHPCQQTKAGETVDVMMRLCYSDVPLWWQGPLGQGKLPWTGFDFDQPVLVGLFVLLGRLLTRLAGVRVASSVSAQEQLDGANVFFQVNAVLLFVCFLVVVGCQLLLGGRSAQGQRLGIGGRLRSWDAMLVAAAPAVLTAGLINVDLLAVALTSLAMLLWATRHPRVAGVALGLACGVRLYPVLLLVALVLLCRRAGRLDEWLRLAVPALLTWLALNLPLLLASPEGLWAYPKSWFDRGPDMGSLWFVAKQIGLTLPAPSVLAILCMLVWLTVVVLLVQRAPRRPRLAQVMLLLVLGFLVCNKTYSPQQVLWLLPLVVMARPVLRDWALWSAAETLYWWAVWGHLGGQLAPGDGSPDTVYWAAIVFRVGIQLWLATQVVHDMAHPWDDPVRTPFVDDPAGGPLDHAPDAPVSVAEPGEAAPTAIEQAAVAFPGGAGAPMGVADRLRELAARPDVRMVALAFVVTRALMLLVALTVVDRTGRSLGATLSAWDVAHFEAIARNGYAEKIDRAFFPGLPLLLRAADAIGLPMAGFGVLLGLGCTALAAAALYRLGGAWAALWWLAAPMAVFTSVAYTEAPFCAAAFWAWERASKKHWVSAALLASLATSFRISGLFLVGALGLLALCQTDVPWRRRLVNGVLAAVPLLVIGAYFAYLHQLTGLWNAWLEAQQTGWSRGFTSPLDSLQHTLEAASPAKWPDRPAVARVFALEVVAMVVGSLVTLACLVRRRWAEAGWVGVQVFAFATSYWFMSVNRAVLLWFPLFLLLGAASSWRTRASDVRRLVRVASIVGLVLCVAAQLWWARLYFTGAWAS